MSLNFCAQAVFVTQIFNLGIMDVVEMSYIYVLWIILSS